MKTDNNQMLLLGILMLTIVIDIMGVGLVFPVIPEIIFSHNSVLFAPETSQSTRSLYYGVSMAAWPLGIFIGSAIIGRLSDNYGRKTMLIASLIGTAIAYLLSVLAFHSGSLALFIFSRFICGFFGGSFSIAQTVILDISTSENRIKNLSLITLAASIGFIFGPIITTIVGMLATTEYQAINLPFLFGAILAIVNLISVCMFLPETYTKPLQKAKLHLISLIFSFRIMFIDKRVQILALAFLMLQIGWGYYAQALPLALAKLFGFGQSAVGGIFIVLSAGFALSTLWVQQKVLKRLSSKQAMYTTATLLALIFLLAATWINVGVMIFSAFFSAMIQIIFYTALLAVIASMVEEHEQGAIMGGATSVFGVAWFINAFSLGPIVNLNVIFPFYLAAIALAFGGFFSYLHYKRR
ncbi:MFS transporter [Fangia hongkongensis]|uniref:MFS transporter n=1 Tax=Fangia hongkongensis TaxID=270495 RepID=UPI0003677371|nr:MFS transporter [Fangia hongkongensis]MBK2126382.1 MFS transporter [Fangia hongkongensis]